MKGVLTHLQFNIWFCLFFTQCPSSNDLFSEHNENAMSNKARQQTTPFTLVQDMLMLSLARQLKFTGWERHFLNSRCWDRKTIQNRSLIWSIEDSQKLSWNVLLSSTFSFSSYMTGFVHNKTQELKSHIRFYQGDRCYYAGTIPFDVTTVLLPFPNPYMSHDPRETQIHHCQCRHWH